MHGALGTALIPIPKRLSRGHPVAESGDGKGGTKASPQIHDGDAAGELERSLQEGDKGSLWTFQTRFCTLAKRPLWCEGRGV